MTLSIVYGHIFILNDGHSVWYPRPHRLSAVDYKWIKTSPYGINLINLIIWND